MKKMQYFLAIFLSKIVSTLRYVRTKMASSAVNIYRVASVLKEKIEKEKKIRTAKLRT
jgi:hypothetical protein